VRPLDDTSDDDSTAANPPRPTRPAPAAALLRNGCLDTGAEAERPPVARSGRRLSVIACGEWGRDAGPEPRLASPFSSALSHVASTGQGDRLLQDRLHGRGERGVCATGFMGGGRELPTFDELILITKYLVVRDLQGEQCR
jgi:hypothetical protein